VEVARLEVRRARQTDEMSTGTTRNLIHTQKISMELRSSLMEQKILTH